MAAPSKLFTVILDSQVDPDSPLTTGLMTELRDNDIHLEEWLGKNFVAAIDHFHDGTDSKKVGGIGDAAIKRNKFSLTLGPGPGAVTVSTGAIGFDPFVALVATRGNFAAGIEESSVGYILGLSSASETKSLSFSLGVSGNPTSAAISASAIALLTGLASVTIDITAFAAAGITFSATLGTGETVSLEMLILGT